MNDVVDHNHAAHDASGVERELKLDVAPADIVVLRRRLASFAGGRRRPVVLTTTYFDTEAGDLRKANVTLRVRRQGRAFKQTIKHGEGGFGLFERLEIERPASGGAPKLLVGERQTLERLLGGPIDPERPFVPVFVTTVKRTVFPIARGLSLVEAALDEAVIEAAGRRTDFFELELELKAGEPYELFGLARELMTVAPLRVGVLAKSARGWELAIGKGPRASFKAKGSAVSPGMTVEQAFLTIVTDCVGQFRRNEALILEAPNDQAVHQARVALRRLRSAFTLFKPVIAHAKTVEIAEGLKWLAGELAGARDLDVLIAAEQAAREDCAAPDSALPAILQQRRGAAYAAAVAALNAPRALSLILDLGEWTAIGAWRTQPHSAVQRGEEASLFAARVLEKRFAQLMKGSKRLAEIDVEARHEARKEAKKLRYATDFFGRLYEGNRYDAFADQLAKLQETLGALNDVATARETTAVLARTSGDAMAAYAAGLLAGRAEASAPKLLEEAEKRRAKLKKAKPFWV